MVNDENGWISFLNYYYWMQATVDAQIGRVITTLKGNSTLWANTIIIFTSDHGDYGGSHNLRAKGAGLYDEAINVPLFVSYPQQRTGTYGSGSPVLINDFLTSGVDVLPYIYTLAAGSETWRSNSAGHAYYLRNRESIADAIYVARYGGTLTQRRLVEIALSSGTVTLPYILHTTDEDLSAEVSGYGAQPSHAIAFRTADFSVTPAGGAKLGMYSFWPSETSECASGVSATAPYGTSLQYELYDYSNGTPPNYGEVGNQALYKSRSTPTLTSEASAYLAAFNSIKANELYYIFSESALYSAYESAYTAYVNYAGLTGWCYTPPAKWRLGPFYFE